MADLTRYLTPELTALIGSELTGEPEYVERNDIRYFGEAVRWPQEPKRLYVDERYARASRFGGLIAAPTYMSRFARRGGYSWPLPLPQWLRDRPGVSASAIIEQVEPIRAGDAISTRTRVADVRVEEGDHGPLLYLPREFEFTNQLGQRVGMMQRTTVRYLESGLHHRPLPPRPTESGGRSIPPFANRVTLMELNYFAGANREWGQYHMDPDFARSLGLRDVLVIENLKLAYLANMLEDWVGEEGWIQRLAVEYTRLDAVGDTLTARGQVTREWTTEGKTHAECEVWLENQDEEQGTVGTAAVTLPPDRA
jgi:acyl dehydratase